MEKSTLQKDDYHCRRPPLVSGFFPRCLPEARCLRGRLRSLARILSTGGAPAFSPAPSLLWALLCGAGPRSGLAAVHSCQRA